MAPPSHQPDEEETPRKQDSLDYDSAPLISQASLYHPPTPPATSSTLFTSTSGPNITSESNPNYPQHESFTIINLCRPMTVTESTFAGPCFLSNSTWSRYHRIEIDGDIENKSGRDLKRLYPDGNHEQILQAITKASTFGSAAARITVTIRKPSGAIIYTTQTGTWVMGHYFITCPHFFQGLDEQAKIRNYHDLSNVKQQANASVCSYGDATSQDGTISTADDRPVWLLICNETADIAIFRAHETDTAKQKKHRSLSKKDLVALPSPFPKQPAWTVAYSGHNSLLVDSPLMVNSPTPEEQQILNNPASTRFDLLLHWSLKSLKARARDQYAEATKHGNPLPVFSKLFIPEERALAVGEIMNTPSDDFQPEDMLDKDMLNSYGIRGRHTISGFWGCSGAPICVFENGNPESPKMIGIFRGDIRFVDSNQFIQFTETGLQWIFEAIESDAPPSAALSNFSLDDN
ncbi:hypothetical protein BDR22DRAFT_864558 [Usnea florida]